MKNKKIYKSRVFDGKWIYIDFLCKSKSGKTNIYQVMNKGLHLGDIKWWSPWRKYAFFPEEGTLFEQDCLRDIAEFIEKQMGKRRNK